MDVLMFVLVAVLGFVWVFLVASVIWAAVMIYRVMRGLYGDPTDLGGDDGSVRPEP